MDARSQQAPQGRSPNILVIDDEPDIRTIATLALEKIGGYAVTSAASGAEGLACADRGRPDGVLLDVMMPDMDGPATLARLRQLPGGGAIPVIMMTAKARPQEIERFMRMGIAGVIPKPFDPLTLSAQVSALIKSGEGRK